MVRKLSLTFSVLAGGMALAGAAPALANSAAYFHSHSVQSDVPTLLSQTDRDYYRTVFAALDRQEWEKVEALLAERRDGPLHLIAQAEYYLDANSPRIELDRLEAWLRKGHDLPQAAQIARLALTRGLGEMPDLPREHSFQYQPAAPKRTRPATISDGTLPEDVRRAILERITNDDPDGARQLLDGIDARLSPEARAEWRQRVAWSYYIENDDAASLAMANTVSDGRGPWVAEGNWVAGLAAWRMGDCMAALSSFENAGRNSTNPELTAAAYYWANRAAIRCRMPDRAGEYLQAAARHDETLYGMLAAEQLGVELPNRYANADFNERDWRKLRGSENVQIAIQLAEIGEDNLASEALIYQAKIGDPSDYESLTRLARCLGLASTQLYMAHNAPRGGKPDPSIAYPLAKWQPVTGWKVDPALAYAHTLQESNFRTAVVSPANAKGLMQITPITVREHAPRLNMSASAVDLADPSVNLAFGQENLEMLRDARPTEGKLPKIMAAYNAGLSPVTRWNDEIRDQNDPLLYMESIPYWETRGYVAIVMRNYWMYERQAQSHSPSRLALASGHWPAFPDDNSGNGRVYLSASNGYTDSGNDY